jgi:tetratricopeptide (TPR) repeat protein
MPFFGLHRRWTWRLAAAALCAAAGAAAPAAPPSPLQVEDPPAAFRPQQPRTPAEQDRVEALAMFAAARRLADRGEDEPALRLYQRAWRLDPQSQAILREIVPLAYRMKRQAVAVRYAVKVAAFDHADPLLLRHLAGVLADDNDWAGALKLYERAAVVRGDARPRAEDIVMQMEMGRLYHLDDNYAKAAACFDRVLQAVARPDDFGISDKIHDLMLGEPGPTYNLIGECYLLTDRPKDALAMFAKAHKLAPDAGAFGFNRARVAARTGKPAEALAALEQCFAAKLDAEGTAPFELLAESLEKLGRKGELLAQLEKLRADDPTNAPLGYYLAEQYLAAGKTEQAEPLYQKLLQTHPTVSGYRKLTEILRKARKPQPLLEVLGGLVTKTDGLDALGSEAEALAADAELVTAVVAAAREKLQAAAAKVSFGERFAVGMLALEAKQFDAAAEWFEQALKAEKAQPADVLMHWGVGLIMADRFAEAGRVFQRGIDQAALPADNPAFYFYLAGALELGGRTDEALAAGRRTAQIAPDAPRFASREAWVLYHAKRYAAAEKAYRALLAKFDGDQPQQATRDVLRDARLVLSNLAILGGRMPEAEEWLEQVLDEFPDDVGALNDLGYLWADQDKALHRALPMIEKAVEAEPDNPAYRDSLGWVFFRLGRHADALRELEKAAGLRADGVVLEHLADAYVAARQTDKAQDAYRRAAAAYAKDGEPEKARAAEDKAKTLPPGGTKTNTNR